MVNPQRSKSADVLKAISIFGVVFIHSTSLFFDEENRITTTITSIYRFCVPIFIVLFAYFMEKTIILRNDNIVKYLRGRFNKLVVPFIFWSFLYSTIFFNFNSGTLIKYITSHWLGYGWSGQYYFIILFQLMAFYIPLRMVIDLLNIKTTIICSLLLYLLFGYFIWDNFYISRIGDRLFIYWIPYLIYGILSVRKQYFDTYNLNWKIGLVALLAIPVESVILDILKISHSPYIAPSVLISSIFFTHSIMSLNLTYQEQPSILEKAIQITSQRTLGIFCINPLIIYLLHETNNKFFNLDFNYIAYYLVIPILSAMFIFILTLLIIYFLELLGLKSLVRS